MKVAEKEVRVPLRILNKFIEAEDELFDWLVSKDEKLLKRLTRTRRRDLGGEFIEWEKVKKELDIP